MQEYINFNSFTVDSINRKDLLHYYWAKNLYYFDAIEKHSDRKAREMGFDGANEEYFMEVYTHNSNEHY